MVDLPRTYDAAGMEGGFIYTLVAPSYPSSPDPELDLDAASYCLVRTGPIAGRNPRRPSGRLVPITLALVSENGLSLLDVS